MSILARSRLNSKVSLTLETLSVVTYGPTLKYVVMIFCYIPGSPIYQVLFQMGVCLFDNASLNFLLVNSLRGYWHGSLSQKLSIPLKTVYIHVCACNWTKRRLDDVTPIVQTLVK